MTTPSVAVVIPSYNHNRYIEATLESVFRQTLRPQEIHVIDDGSTDDSVRVIERALAGARSIRCSLTVRENRGISTTRNELCAATTTDFVAFLDSDDLYAPERLERMLAGAPRGGLYFAFSGVDFLSELGDETLAERREGYHERLGQGMSLPTAGFALLRSNVAMSTSNFVVSRGLLDAVGGFDERIKICQDWDFAVQTLRFVEPTFIPEPLLTYRIHSRNTSRDAYKFARWELDLLHDKLSKWFMQPTPNRRAPTPRNWPRFFRVFAHLNTYFTGQVLASHLPREGLAATSEPATSERETKAIRDLISVARFPDLYQNLSSDELMKALSANVDRSAMSGHLSGQLSWLGYSLPIAVPDDRWFDWLKNFTGLEIEPAEERTTAPVLFVVDDRHVLVDDRDLRTFSCPDELKAWLFLTVSDVMICRGGFTALHTAGFVVAGQAILVSGPPWAGKSSWAFEAQSRGLEVLGDDQVRVEPRTGAVYGLPRPLKRRLLAEAVEQNVSEDAVRAHLDGEYVALEPRGTGGLAPVDRGYPVARIVHLARHDGPGVDVHVLDKFRAFQSILDQMRAYSATFLADAAATARILGRLPSMRMSVGDGQISRALDISLDLT